MSWKPLASSAASARGWSLFKRTAAPRWYGPMKPGRRRRHAWENAHTIASGIRVPQAVGDFLILRAVRESGGFAIAVSDERLRTQ